MINVIIWIMLSLWLSQKSLLTSKIGVGTINLDFVNQLFNVISLNAAYKVQQAPLHGITLNRISLCRTLNSLYSRVIFNWFRATIRIGTIKAIKSSGYSDVGSEPSNGMAGSESISSVSGEIRVPSPKENPGPKKYERPARAKLGR